MNVINVHGEKVKKSKDFSTGFRKILRYQKSRKSVQWEPSSSMRSDRHDEANTVSHFLTFAKAHKNLCTKICYKKRVFACTCFITSLSIMKLRDEFTCTLPGCRDVTVENFCFTHTHTHALPLTSICTHTEPCMALPAYEKKYICQI